MSEKESKPAFSAKEMEYMAAVLMSLKDGGLPTVANIDIPKFAKIAGLTEGSCRTIWSRLRAKILAQPSAASAADGLSATPKTGGKAKPKAAPGSKRKGGEDGDGDVAETPSKKPRAKRTKAKEVMDEVEDIKDEEDKDEEIKDEDVA